MTHMHTNKDKHRDHRREGTAGAHAHSPQTAPAYISFMHMQLLLLRQQRVYASDLV